ncbi:hypothetical protein B0H13DRAFT_429890 [Mycena leptocephala]|nr:hypothetical protein B0H13DRAFT_429890 [Mycena leptocephala]
MPNANYIRGYITLIPGNMLIRNTTQKYISGHPVSARRIYLWWQSNLGPKCSAKLKVISQSGRPGFIQRNRLCFIPRYFAFPTSFKRHSRSIENLQRNFFFFGVRLHFEFLCLLIGIHLMRAPRAIDGLFVLRSPLASETLRLSKWALCCSLTFNLGFQRNQQRDQPSGRVTLFIHGSTSCD